MTTQQTYKRIVSVLRVFVEPRRSTGGWLHAASTKLSDYDCALCTDVIALTVALWYTCLHWNQNNDDDRWVSRWFKSIGDPDIVELFGAFKDADSFILSFIEENGSIPSLHDFKGHCAKHGTTLFLFPLFQCWSLFMDEELVRVLHQCLSFPLHTPVGNKAKNDLYGFGEDAVQKFVLLERELGSRGVIPGLESIFQNWFKTFRIPRDALWPCKHGNGAVADSRKSIAHKYRSFCYDTRMRYTAVHYNQPLPFDNGGTFVRCNKLQFAPKNYKTYRTIAMEPAMLMWLQQGLRTVVDEYVVHHNFLRKRFNLRDQSLNRDLAWEGSLVGNYATIDLSSASDSVSWKDFKAWATNTEILPAVLLSRSTHCKLPSGEVICLNKLASMGNNLTFYMECFTFGAIVESCLVDRGISPKASGWRVYGDDIVVETEIAKDVMSKLEYFGFSVNRDKSYMGTGNIRFRESCGGHYVNGVDITPIVISRFFEPIDYNDELPSWPVHVLELVNSSTRFRPFRQLLINILNQLRPALRPIFDSTGDGAIFSTAPTNFHLQHFYDPSYQADSVICGKPLQLYEAVEDEEVRLFEYLRMVEDRPQLLFPEDARGCQVDLPKRMVWVPTRTILS